MSWKLARVAGLLGLLVAVAPRNAARGDEALRREAAAAMRRAAEFYRTQVASHGGYVYHYSADLQQRWGEGAATANQIWVQPPGTPTVGLAYLAAWEATGERVYLDAASAAGEALVYGQLKSGGWMNCIDFDPRGERVGMYRNGQGRGRNNSSLDDGQSQAALRFLVHLDQALEFKDPRIHEAAHIALAALLQAQFPVGAFPQSWTGPVSSPPAAKANYPDYDWRTEGRIKNYWDMYTLNDGLAGTVAAVLIDAHRIYGDAQYEAALKRLGDFLLAAQMPDPQLGWAQQYNYAMQPIWARAFEPPGVSGWESQDALLTLLAIARHTGDPKYLEPLPRALRYLRRSLLPDGQLARYYELQTNRPLYMSRQGDTYSLTYDDSDLPSHYGWKMPSRLDEIESQYQRLKRGETAQEEDHESDRERQVRQIILDLDEQGRWLSTYQGERLVGQPKFPVGMRYLSSEVFCRNLELLSRYVRPR